MNKAFSLKQFLRSHWGSLYFWALLLPALYHPATAPMGGHYEFFYKAAKSVWAGENPYLFTNAFGGILYHPSCALFFYGFFALFPYHLGITLYTLSSLIFAYLGLVKLLGTLGIANDQRKNIFFFIASSEFLGTVQNVRIELFTVGCLAYTLSFFVQKKYARAALSLAAPSIFKIQALAIGGLLTLSLLKEKKILRMAAFYAGGLSVVFFSPVLVTGFERFVFLMSEMNRNITTLVSGAFNTFLHLFAFIDTVFSTHTSYQTGARVSAIIALAFAAIIVAIRRKSLELKTYLAVGLASVFMTSFSLMSQSAAYILVLPFMAICFLDFQRRAMKVGIFASWFIMSLLYSDLVPRIYYQSVFRSAIKSTGPIVLLIAWIFVHRAQLFCKSAPEPNQ